MLVISLGSDADPIVHQARTCTGFDVDALSGAPTDAALAPAIALLMVGETEENALMVLDQLRSDWPATDIVVMSRRASLEFAIAAFRHGAGDVVVAEECRLDLADVLARAAGRWRRCRRDAAVQHHAATASLLLDSISDIVIALDATLTVLYVSRSVTRLLGYAPEDLVGRSWLDFAHDDDLQTIRAACSGLHSEGCRYPCTVRLRHQQGTWCGLETTTAKLDGGQDGVSALITARDVTDRERLRQRLQLAERMDSIGQVAGRVAHDFNNLLSTILGFTEFVLNETPRASAAYADLQAIQQAAEQGALLGRQLLALSSRQVFEPRVVSLSALIANMRHLLSRLHEAHARSDVTRAPGRDWVRIDPSQMEQVITNLVVNACEAMGDGGALVLETDVVRVDEPDAPPGDYVVLRVRDTGCGIAPEGLSRVFEPFYTTKSPHAHPGLGLSTVYGIVRQSGGHLAVHSVVSQGTSMSVYLPAVGPDPQPEEQYVRPPRREVLPVVMLVEDEAPLRKLFRRQLEHGGYAVLEAESGAVALNLFYELAQAPALLITDVVLPGLSGPSMVQQIRATHPTLPVLFISGFSNDDILTPGITHAFDAALQKPFGAAALLKRVQGMLGSPQSEIESAK